MDLFSSDFFLRPSYDVAPDLIGCCFLFYGEKGLSGGLIVETEAYEPDDPASHSYRGKTEKNAAMFGRSGCAYIYRCYGVHWCFNMVCLPGSAVLIRALEPLVGVSFMQENRNVYRLSFLCSGPGKLCQALGITSCVNGFPLNSSPFSLTPSKGNKYRILKGSRIGISVAREKKWRFGMEGSSFLSRKF